MPDPLDQNPAIFEGRNPDTGPYVRDDGFAHAVTSLFPTSTDVTLFEGAKEFAAGSLNPVVNMIENPDQDPHAMREALAAFIQYANNHGGIGEVEIPLNLLNTGLRNPDHLAALKEAISAAQDQGLVNLTVPDSLGGMGFSLRQSSFVIRAIVAGSSAGMATSICANDLALTPIVIAGTEAQKDRFVTSLIQAKGLAAFCLTEPGAGSNPAQMTSKAIDKGDHYLLSGSKMWITNHVLASELVVFAKDPALPEGKNFCCFVVPADAKGVTIGKIEHKLGQHCSPTGAVSFDEVVVPKDQLIGAAGKGLHIALGTLEKSRPLTAALAWGVTTAAFDCALRYVNQREQGGKLIGDHQLVQAHIAWIQSGLMESESAVLRAAALADHPSLVTQTALDGRLASSNAKLRCAQIAVEASRRALQVHGGYGFSEEYPPARLLRDAQVIPVYEGTDEVQIGIIGGILNHRARSGLH